MLEGTRAGSGQFERCRQAVGEQLADRNAAGEGEAEIAAQDAAQPGPVTDQKRLIEAEGVAQFFEASRIGGALGAQHARHGVAGRQVRAQR